MSKFLRHLRHEPVAYWMGLLAVVQAVLTAAHVLPTVAGVAGAVVTAVSGGALRQLVTPVPPAETGDGGHLSADLAVLVLILAGIVLLLFGARLHF